MIKCTEPGCNYEAKTKGAITQHVNREHNDPLAKLRNEFGDGAPLPGGAIDESRPLKAAPSGIPSIDWVLGIGGIPRGSMIEVFGPPKAGKTFTALTFSAWAQQQGERAGFLNVEDAPMETFLPLVRGLNVPTLDYSEPLHGTQAMELTRRFVKSGEYGIWTVDSIHACIPADVLEAEIGSSRARAGVARLMSESLPVLAKIVARTNTSLVLINHIKEIPTEEKYGRSWYTPGGSAPEYYASTRLHVWASGAYIGKESKKQIGHRVKVKVEKSKVTAPFSIAEYDLYYHPDIRKDTGRPVLPGVDVASAWFFVLYQEGKITRSSSGQVIDTETGEKLGSEADVLEQLSDEESPLIQAGREIVYPAQFA
jgi:recombination protein RecA